MMAMPAVSTADIDFSGSYDNSTSSYYEQVVNSEVNFTNNITTTANKIFFNGKNDFSQVSSIDIKAFNYSDEFHKMILEKSWVVTFLQNAGQLNNVKSLLPYYKKINELMAEEQFPTCNIFLENIRVNELSDVLLVGLLRLTYSRKNHLDAWVGLLKKSKDELSKRGHDSQSLLKGLS